MNVTESCIDDELRDCIDAFSEQAAKILEDANLIVDASQCSAKEMINGIDRCVAALQSGGGPRFPDEDDPAVLLGCLWGQQLVKQFKWEWANLTFHDHNDTKTCGVFPSDRSLAIFPWHFILGCLEQGAPVTIALSFEILSDPARVPPLPSRGYENVMDHAHHDDHVDTET